MAMESLRILKVFPALTIALMLTACGTGSNTDSSGSAPSALASTNLDGVKDSQVMRGSCGGHKVFLQSLDSFGLESLAEGQLPSPDGAFGGLLPTTMMQRTQLSIFLGEVAKQVGPLDESSPQFALDTYHEWAMLGEALQEDGDRYEAYSYDSQKLLLESLDRINANCAEIYGADWAAQ
ncbi:MAG: hypothetical protein F2839_06520 [Actinobacteria bacterium]|uniref:Unannotated protein n=1 Tax=freshwater metagenome TaxID=449393 RepID=A0A6J5ZMG6_9ZZZZ|nr:hypothetical protein [Actinomycetota bacterium]